jgi:TetR/AcrR family tetracycline transcriptional repressor
MPLTRQQIITAAAATLREQGLAGLSMRGVAQRLDVRAGALYYHVTSKQELLLAVGEQILADSGVVAHDVATAADQFRALLLAVRDGAEVISFVYAYKPAALAQFANLGDALIRFVLGFVAVDQNRAELVRARILELGPAEDEDFRAGVRTMVAGAPRQA